MIRLIAPLLLLAVLAPASGDVLITRDGKRHIGKVTQDGKVTSIETQVETLKFQADDVLIVFETPKQAHEKCLARFEQAKKTYDEARAMPEKSPLRRQRLGVALDIAKNVRDLLEILSRYYTGKDHEYFLDLMRTIPQFMRLCRDSMGSAMIGDGLTTGTADKVSLESSPFTFTAPPVPDRPWVLLAELGDGQAALVAQLSNENIKKREDAVRGLSSPPAPHALAALLKAWEKETDDKVLKGLVDATWRLDIEPQFKKGLAWAVKDTDAKRRASIADLCKRLATKGACEFLVECFKETPPTTLVLRAIYCSAFRKMSAWSVDELREGLAKAREKAAIAEFIKQLGMLRHAKAGPALKNAMIAYAPNPATKNLWGYAYFGLEAMGKTAVPALIEGMSGATDDVRRCCKFLAKRATGEYTDNAADFSKWWVRYHKMVEDEDQKFWREQAAKDFPVNGEEFRIFDRKFDEPRN